MSGHPADADYLSQNLPNETDLDAMMESALALADVMQGRRRVASDGRGIPLMIAMDPGSDRPVVSAREGRPRRIIEPLEPTRQARYAQAMAAAAEGSATLTAEQRAEIYTARVVVESIVKDLRELEVDDPVFGHALNTLDLGVVGLARVAGKEGDGA